MLIKAFCLGILFIHRQTFNGILLYSVLNELFPQIFSPLLRGYK